MHKTGNHMGSSNSFSLIPVWLKIEAHKKNSYLNLKKK